jgi:hypothetical protein
MPIRVLMLGDIVGQPGRLAVRQLLPALRALHKPHLVIANGENCAKGTGLLPDQYAKLRDMGIDGVTLGDHVFKRAQIIRTLESEAALTRPANLSRHAKGRRWMQLQPRHVGDDGAPGDPMPGPAVYVVTVLGRIFMNMPADDPFATVEQVLTELPDRHPIVIVEVHAEATSEKVAMGWHFNGRVAAVLGTHTHIPTADARVLPGRDGGPPTTAYITDLGMCGPFESVIGRQIAPVLTYMTRQMPAPFDVAEGDPRVCGALVEIDEATRRATRIERVEMVADVGKPPFVMGVRGME